MPATKKGAGGKTATKAVAKKVAAKVTTKTVATPAPVTPPPAPKFAVGDIAVFTKYTPGKSGAFTSGEEVYIHSINEIDHPTIKGRKMNVFVAVKAADAEAAKADPELDHVEAEELPSSSLRVKVVKEPEPEYHPVAVGAVVEYVAQTDLTAVARSLLERQQQTEFEIGGVLAFIRYEHMDQVSSLGYTDTTDDQGKQVTAWVNYLRGELNVSVRTADDYIHIYRSYSSLSADKFNPAMISAEGVGWSKAVLVANYVTEENVDEVMKLAAETPIRELREVMRTRFTDDAGRPTSGMGRQTGARAGGRARLQDFGPFKLAEEQARGVQAVLDMGQKQLGLGIDATFEHIVREWGNEHLTAANKRTATQRIQSAAPAPAATVKRQAPTRTGAAKPAAQPAAEPVAVAASPEGTV